MYFYTKDRAVCHILEDTESGKAPAPCGSKVDKLALISFRAGKLNGTITAEKPADIPLCKHCQKSEAYA
jgi:hypothetical protein